MSKKENRCEKIIQFGEGGFLRGFVDWIIQILNEKTDYVGEVVVVQPIDKGMCDVLEAQNCDYTHVMRGLKDGVPTVDKKFIDCISRTVKPYDDFEKYLALAEKPDFRFVVSNTTEAGIVLDESDTNFDETPNTFPGKVLALLRRRYEHFNGDVTKGLSFICCELIDYNGEELRKCVLGLAHIKGYPSSM